MYCCNTGNRQKSVLKSKDKLLEVKQCIHIMSDQSSETCACHSFQEIIKNLFGKLFFMPLHLHPLLRDQKQLFENHLIKKDRGTDPKTS
jgi:hypothetical protein